MDNRNLILGIIGVMILLVGTHSVLAFGISSPYWDDNPLEMYSGQTKEILFNLQNCPSREADCQDDKDINIVVTFEEGEEIAEIMSGTNYNVLYGSADTDIILRVTIPESSSIGERYDIAFSISSPVEDESGNVQLGIKYNIGFPVNVVAEAVEKPVIEETASNRKSNVLVWALVVVIILIVFYFVLRRKK